MSSKNEIGFLLFGGGVAISEIGVGAEGGYVAVKQSGGSCQLYYFAEFTSGILGGCCLTPTKPIETAYIPADLSNCSVSISIGGGVAGWGTVMVSFLIANGKYYEVFSFKEKLLDLRGLSTGELDVAAKLARDSRLKDAPLTKLDYSRYGEYAAGLTFERAMGRQSLLTNN